MLCRIFKNYQMSILKAFLFRCLISNDFEILFLGSSMPEEEFYSQCWMPVILNLQRRPSPSHRIVRYRGSGQRVQPTSSLSYPLVYRQGSSPRPPPLSLTQFRHSPLSYPLFQVSLLHLFCCAINHDLEFSNLNNQQVLSFLYLKTQLCDVEVLKELQLLNISTKKNSS